MEFKKTFFKKGKMLMTKIGYARVSSKEQNLDRQLQALQGVSKLE